MVSHRQKIARVIRVFAHFAVEMKVAMQAIKNYCPAGKKSSQKGYTTYQKRPKLCCKGRFIFVYINYEKELVDEVIYLSFGKCVLGPTALNTLVGMTCKTRIVRL